MNAPHSLFPLSCTCLLVLLKERAGVNIENILNLQLFFLANGGLSQTNVKANATVTKNYIIGT